MAGDTVLLTGITGFIAKHVAVALVQAGYRVRGTVRDLARADEVRAAVRAGGADPASIAFVAADLLRDAGWEEACRGCRFVLHTASPFPMRQSRDRQRLVPAARGGTQRVVAAAKAAGVERVVMTSSVVAVYYGHAPGRAAGLYSEADWTNTDDPSVSDYAVSKTLAERAAWDALAEGGPSLCAINPSFVLGPVLDAHGGTSARLVRAMMAGRLPLVPRVSFGIVDCRDVAAAHVAALDHPAAGGRRFLLSGGSRSMLEIGDALAAFDPALRGRVPKANLPDALVRLLAFVVPSARAAVPELGRPKNLDVSPARDLLGISFRPPETAIAAMAESLRRLRLA
ncbi:NAD-dependent epimerase/dehydratase family protein [Aurantimonas sp. Leaf443]|uniref:NAD-dependent epimerase/dehydratase family protein n=1 Tax=Aurantimonas sp. Leaf443 TaxID=1736378 RepID=UPI0006FAC865|nr:NAD-dependent epimerase/dehydratase family protein [Aurantimonas sp. Leaf443]KQT83547.1 dihydrofolate synthase [Aurantimonas sp. Leaf443]